MDEGIPHKILSAQNFVQTQNFAQNRPTCAELTKRHRKCKIKFC